MIHKSKEIDSYISTFPEEIQERLEEIRGIIGELIPDTTELINYGIPAFTLIVGGKREQQIMIAGYKNHIGFYPDPTTIESFKEELANFQYAKGSVQFPLDKPLPKDLIQRMISYRLKLLK